MRSFFFDPAPLLAVLRTIGKRLAFHSALVACAALALVGGLVVDDYGSSADTVVQRQIAINTLAYMQSGNPDTLHNNERYYGPAFELVLLAGERLLGLQDSRRIHLLRHGLTHLFFLGAGWGCAWLTFRRYGSRGLALCALGLFLLHPRLYAHSFFNSKDLPFLSMFMLTLCLAHRALRRNTLGAFALCGAGVGILTSIRVLGAMLFVAVLGLRALDALRAADGAARRHVLRTGVLFAAASALAMYATWPYLWADPFSRLAEAFRFMAHHHQTISNLFRGQYLGSQAVPPAYIPVWFAVTAPPGALLFGLLGALAWLRRGLARPRALGRNTPLRFEGLLAACVLLPVLAVILLGSTLYNGWRQMYFLYAPFCLLATAGLHAAAAALAPYRQWVYGLVGLGLGTTAAAMLVFHPHQYDYFNFLTPRATPEGLATQYTRDYWEIALREALDELRRRYPAGPLRVSASSNPPLRKTLALLPAAARSRIAVDAAYADFHIQLTPGANRHAVYAPSFTRRVYNSVLFDVAALNLALVDAAAAAPYRAHYRAATAHAPVARARFDIYLDARAVTYVQAPCRPADAQPRFFLHVTPVDPRRLPPPARAAGFANLDFAFYRRGVRLAEACLATVPLPAYALRRISTGQWAHNRILWRADIALPPSPAAQLRYRAAYEALAPTAPAVRAVFDVYVTAEAATYVKTPCQAADTAPKFVLHVFPVRPDNLPAERQAHGFDNLDFQFDWQGAHFDGTCLAQAPLPAYAIQRLRVGQFRADELLWQEEIPFVR